MAAAGRQSPQATLLVPRGALISAQQLTKLVGGKPGLSENPRHQTWPKCAWVIRHDGHALRLWVAQYYVATALTAHRKACPF